jgi:predicted Zn-ribbon and HTH transcriptional regulator
MNGKKHEEPSGPRPPAAAHDTVRHELLAELERGPLSALELSGRVGISEKEVYEHLQHIRTTLHRNKRRLVVQPAECVKCGFIFHKRERLKKPSKCPVCRGGFIHEPLFSLGEEK